MNFEQTPNQESNKEKIEQREYNFFSVSDIISRLNEVFKEGRFGESFKELSFSEDLSSIFSIKDGRISISLDGFRRTLSLMLDIYYPVIRLDDEKLKDLFYSVLEEFGCTIILEEEREKIDDIKYSSQSKLFFNMPHIVERDYVEFPYPSVGGTPANEISDDIVILSSPHYGKSAMQRPFPWKGKHAWAIRRSGLEDFLYVYNDGEFIEITPNSGSLLYAINFEEADKYVCEVSDSEAVIPKIEKFDPEKHLVEEGEPPFSVLGGFYDDMDEPTPYFITPFQVLIRDPENLKK